MPAAPAAALVQPPHRNSPIFSILFFIRGSSNQKFMYCGKATYIEHEESEDDLIHLVLELTDYHALVDHGRDSQEENTTYMDIVQSQG
jgi:hypothetical protein